ncbi:hypothetical protein [uncultured Brachyspira sp.]|uniref:YcjF family protein n=1 Tax=uncultured Brachyspira sp. TaxID=221953 RepID=UPI003207FFD7
MWQKKELENLSLLSIEKFESEDLGVILYDSPGYEIDKVKQFDDEVIDIKKKEAVNLVWYCIQASGSKITDFDIGTIKKFRENNLPVSIIFTKRDMVSKDTINILKEVVNKEIGEIDIYEMSSTVEDEFYTKELQRLISDAIKKLPDILRDAFISAQKVNLKEKWNRAHSVIVQHIAGAGIVAFIPIPFSDAPILVANQMGMIARILYIYDLGGLENMLKGGAGGGIIGQLISNLGKTLAVNILAFIPGIGTLVKGLINGGVATLLTSALGEAVNISCYKIYESVLNGNKDIEEQMKMFGDMVQKYATDYFKSGKKPEDYKNPD